MAQNYIPQLIIQSTYNSYKQNSRANTNYAASQFLVSAVNYFSWFFYFEDSTNLPKISYQRLLGWHQESSRFIAPEISNRLLCPRDLKTNEMAVMLESTPFLENLHQENLGQKKIAQGELEKIKQNNINIQSVGMLKLGLCREDFLRDKLLNNSLIKGSDNQYNRDLSAEEELFLNNQISADLANDATPNKTLLKVQSLKFKNCQIQSISKQDSYLLIVFNIESMLNTLFFYNKQGGKIGQLGRMSTYKPTINL